MPATTTPTLIIQGRLDTVVEPANATWLYQNLGASEKALISLPQSDHLVALDRERDQVIQATLEFLLDGGKKFFFCLKTRTGTNKRFANGVIWQARRCGCHWSSGMILSMRLRLRRMIEKSRRSIVKTVRMFSRSAR